MWALVKDGAISEIINSPRSVFVDDTQWPSSIFKRWSNEKLRSIGIYPVETAETQPPGDFYVESGEVYTVEEYRVVRTTTYEPIDLEIAKGMARNMINRWKKEKQDGNFVHNGAEYQCDSRSREFITGASLEAFMSLVNNQPYTITFTDANNNQQVLDANGMIALGKAAADHVKYWHMEALDKKDQVKAAVTVEDIQAVIDSLKEGGA